MIQFNVVPAGSVDSFNLLLYPDQTHQTQQYLQNRLAAVSAQLGGYASGLADQFVTRAKDLYEKVYHSGAMLAAKAAVRAAKGLFHPNAIVPLETIEELQAAQPVMQRYLMANPQIREMYHHQRIDGYSDTYRDLYPDKVGEEHYDYRRVTDGMILTPEERAEHAGLTYDGDPKAPEWSFTRYYDDLVEGDRPLEHGEKSDILSAWRLQAICVAALKDPTNIFGGDVGA